MIEFKTNYTPGPWTTDKFMFEAVGDKYCKMIGQVYFQNKENKPLVVQSPKMAEYMMAKAKELHDFLDSTEDGFFKASKKELQTILSILKDAGIEVVG